VAAKGLILKKDRDAGRQELRAHNPLISQRFLEKYLIYRGLLYISCAPDEQFKCYIRSETCE